MVHRDVYFFRKQKRYAGVLVLPLAWPKNEPRAHLSRTSRFLVIEWIDHQPLASTHFLLDRKQKTIFCKKRSTHLTTTSLQLCSSVVSTNKQRHKRSQFGACSGDFLLHLLTTSRKCRCLIPKKLLHPWQNPLGWMFDWEKQSNALDMFALLLSNPSVSLLQSHLAVIYWSVPRLEAEKHWRIASHSCKK